MATNPVLDFSTDRERPVVGIGGVPYQMRTFDDLTIEQAKTFHRLNLRIVELLALERASAREQTELSAALKAAAEIAIDAPVGVLNRLKEMQRLSVYQVFSELLLPGLRQKSAETATRQTTPSPTGTSSSRASSASSAARRRPGSGTSRSASSART
jgi:hypothetical protein